MPALPASGLGQRPNRVVIGLGGNIGPVLDTLNQAIAILDKTPGITVVQCSSWYQSHPVGPPQPDFINGCALLDVTLSPQALLNMLLAIEQRFGRIRQERWGPRTLDLDLIFYGHQQLTLPNLQIPHPQFHLRPFVLVPLAEIAPQWRDSRSGLTVGELLTQVDSSTVWQVAPFVLGDRHHQRITPARVVVH
ncbi:MAG: 2-amino-4-hydroxy-6-hydroxymethyldihydropteridine diphosphokinase [Synechocystis sp.]|nr:2-amino-4-hydroxy-6-hydroxymethyldihydropteridine diphosphokinase [Synechocystis sp.]